MSLIALLLALVPWLMPVARAQGAAVDEGALATVGETLGDGVVEEIRSHPEFERYTVRLPDGRALPVEVTWVREGSSPTCTQGELGIFPRWELLAEQGAEVRQDPAGLPTTQALCARLAERGEGLEMGPMPPAARDDGPDGADGEPVVHQQDMGVFLPDARRSPAHPLQWVLVGIGVALLASLAFPVRASLDRRAIADALLVLGLAVAVRLFVAPWGLQVAPDAGYERLVMAWGMFDPHPLYGDGFSSLHAALQAATGFDPDAVFALHLALSALAPLVLWWLARELLTDRHAALVAGVGLALLPVAVRLAASEVAHVPLATFELLAVAGAWGFLHRGAPCLALLGALAGAFAVHLRPEALPFAALPALLLLWGAYKHRRALPSGAALVAVALLVGIVAWRVADFPELRDDGPVRMSAWTRPRTWLGLVLPRWTWPPADRETYQIFLHAGLTNPLLPLLALVGLIRGRRPVVAGALVWWALTLLPVFPKGWPTIDAWRLQLSAQAPLLLLASAGVAAMADARARRTAFALVTAIPVLYAGRVGQQWAGNAEWELLQASVGELPPGSVVLVPDHEKHGRKIREVGALLASRAGEDDPDWRGMSAFAAAPDPGSDRYAWVNLTCRIETLPGMGVANDISVNSCLQLAEVCHLEPMHVAELPTATDIDLTLVDPPVTVGFYRIDDCHPKD